MAFAMNEALIGLLAAVGSAIGTLAGVGVALFIGRRADVVARWQRRLDAAAFAAEWFRDLRMWASMAIDVLSEAAYECGRQGDQEAEATLRRCRYRLSGLIDSGRFFLPNVRITDYGTQKPSAFRVFRHSALDPLVAAERAMGGTLGRFNNQREAIVAMKREFVSAIQRILAPEHHNQEIALIVKEFHQTRAGDSTLGGLLPDEHSIPLGDEALLMKPAPNPADAQ